MIEKRKKNMITMLALAVLLLVGRETYRKRLPIWTFWLFFFLLNFSLSQVATEISSDSDYNAVSSLRRN